MGYRGFEILAEYSKLVAIVVVVMIIVGNNSRNLLELFSESLLGIIRILQRIERTSNE